MNLATGYWLQTKKEGEVVKETKASKIHLVDMDEKPWCGTRVAGELVIVSHGVKSDYTDCGRCKAKAKEIEG